MTNDYFKYWNKILNELYRPLVISTTFNNHMFTYDVVSTGVIGTQRVGYSSPDQQWLVEERGEKQRTWTQFDHKQRRQVAQSAELQPLVKPGIKPIKQVRIFTKWLPLCKGKQWYNKICPKPSDEAMKSVKDSNNA